MNGFTRILRLAPHRHRLPHKIPILMRADGLGAMCGQKKRV